MADGAGAVFVDWAGVLAVSCRNEAALALPGIDVAVLRGLQGEHAVKHIYSAVNALHYVAGRADSHKVAGLFFGHFGADGLQNAVHLLRRFAHGEPSYRIARQIERGYIAHVAHADILIRAALVYAEKELIGVYDSFLGLQTLMLAHAALQPAGGAIDGPFDVRLGSGVFYALVEGHGDGGAQLRLHSHGLLRPHEYGRAVYV